MTTLRAPWFLVGAALLVAACGAARTGGPAGTGDDGGGLAGNDGGTGNSDGGTGKPSDAAIAGGDLHVPFNADAFFEKDPPPKYCVFDGGMPPKDPGGTADCPDDKNREGCPCPKLGATAACWPGLRAKRNLGACMDGTTTCVAQGELGQGWGPCMGYVLPTPGAMSGKGACKCFSGGAWKLDNLSPCFYDSGGGPGSGGAASTVVTNGKVSCVPMMGMLMKPTQPWSSDTITADCAGHFKLCYTLKAGDAKKPQPGDCVLAQSCVEGDYTTVNVVQTFPPLPAWVSNDTTCAKKFAQSGYGEMSVDGTSVLCDQVKKVFNVVGYCPLSCATNPNDPMCKQCMQGGGGNF